MIKYLTRLHMAFFYGMEVKKLLKQSYPIYRLTNLFYNHNRNAFFSSIWCSSTLRFSHTALEITNFLTLHETPETDGLF